MVEWNALLSLLIGIMHDLQVYPERMRQNLDITRGLVFSQRVLLVLIEKGLSRQKAYEIVQRNAMRAWREKTDFLCLLEAEPEVSTHLPPEGLRALFDYEYYIRYVDEIFERLGLSEAYVYSS